MKRQVIFDIDLDFFVTPTFRGGNSDQDPRLPDADFNPDTPEQVLHFMTHGLGLDPEHQTPGTVVTHHQEVYYIWEDLVKRGKLTPKFSVVHIDAHDDMFGHVKNPKITSGNYLIHAARQDWLAHIAFVQPCGLNEIPYVADDYKHLIVDGHKLEFSIANKKDMNWSEGEINLKPDYLFLTQSPGYTPESADSLMPVISQFISKI